MASDRTPSKQFTLAEDKVNRRGATDPIFARQADELVLRSSSSTTTDQHTIMMVDADTAEGPDDEFDGA